MCREINYLVVKFELYFPHEGNLSVFGENCSTAEIVSILLELIRFLIGVKGSYIVGI